MPIYKIAGIYVKMEPKYSRCQLNFEKYLVSQAPRYDDLSQNTDALLEDLQNQYPYLGPDACEYMMYGSLFYGRLIQHNGLLLHSSAVVYRSKAYLFSAPSGTGKSTHTSLWLEHLGQRAQILNDDKPALVYEDGQVFVYGTPFSGKTDLNINARYPLGGICYLSRGVNAIRRATTKEALPKILEQTYRHTNSETLSNMLLDVLDRIVPHVSYYFLSCDMSKDAFLTSFETLTGERYEP